MVRQTFPLGTIAGIRIGAHWSILVTIGLFAWILRDDLAGRGSSEFLWSVAAVGALALFASLVAHELAHSIVAVHSGVRVHRIVLWLLGGMSELTDEPRDARTDLRIALAGPLTSLTIGAAAFAAAELTAAVRVGAVAEALVWLAVMNTILAVFNLLPGAPLDGGRVLRAVLWWRSGDRLRAQAAAARSGHVLGTALIVLGAVEVVLSRQFGGLWLMLLGWFLQRAANGELAVAGLRHQLGDTRIQDVMSVPAMVVPRAWTVAELLASHAPDSGHHVFPVVDAGGHPVGILAWPDLAKVPVPARATTSVATLARPLPPAAIVGADELLGDAATRVILRPKLDAITVVGAQGRVMGIVTATDLTIACDRSALGLPVVRPEPLRGANDTPSRTGRDR
jgi:Zn-dependent protease